jgi:hypothetical protein
MGRGSSIPSDWSCLIGWQRAENFRTMAISWRGAACVLLEAWKDAHREKRDYGPWWAYAWLFCWRHALELLLKSVLRMKWQCCGKDLEDCYRKYGHSLGKLWDKAVKVVPELARTDAEESIRFLDKVDPDGMTLRYPLSIDGRQLLNQEDFWVLERHGEFLNAFQRVVAYAEDLPEGSFPPGVRGTQ